MIVKLKSFQNVSLVSILAILLCNVYASPAFCMEDEEKGGGITHASPPPEEPDNEDDWVAESTSIPLEVIKREVTGGEKLPDLVPILRQPTHTEQDFNQAVQRILTRQGSDLTQLVFKSPFCTLAFLKKLKASFDGFKITDESVRGQYESPIHEAILAHPEAKSGDKICVADYYKRIGLQARAGEIYLSLVSERPVVIKRLRAGFEYCKGGAVEAKLHLMILMHHYHVPMDVDAAIAFVMKPENKEWRSETLRALEVQKEIPNDFAVLTATRDAWKDHNKDHVKTIERRILGHAECKNPDRRVIRDSRSGQEAEEIADLIVIERGMVGQYLSGEVYTLDDLRKDLRKAAKLSSKPEKTRGYYARILQVEGHQKADLDDAMGFAEKDKDHFELVEAVLKDPFLQVPDDRLPYLKRAIAFYSTVKSDKKRMNELWREVPLSYFETNPDLEGFRAAHLAWVDLNDIKMSREPLEFLNTLIEIHKDATLADKLIVAYTCLSIPTLKDAGDRKLPDVEKALKDVQIIEDARLQKEIEALQEKIRLWDAQLATKKREKSTKKREMKDYVDRQPRFTSGYNSRSNKETHYTNTEEYKSRLSTINTLRNQKRDLRANISNVNKTIGEKKGLIGSMRRQTYVRVALFFSDLLTPNYKMAVPLWNIVFEADWVKYTKLSSSELISWTPEVRLSVIELQKAAQAYEAETQYERAMLIYKRVYYSHNKDWPIPLKLIQLYVLCGKSGLAQELCLSIQDNSSRTLEQQNEAYCAAYTIAQRTVMAASSAASATTSAVSSAVAAVTPNLTNREGKDRKKR